VWSYTSTPQYAFMAWCIIKHRDNFTFTTDRLNNSNSYPFYYQPPESYPGYWKKQLQKPDLGMKTSTRDNAGHLSYGLGISVSSYNVARTIVSICLCRVSQTTKINCSLLYNHSRYSPLLRNLKLYYRVTLSCLS
jgi:hypothetical protein